MRKKAPPVFEMQKYQYSLFFIVLFFLFLSCSSVKEQRTIIRQMDSPLKKNTAIFYYQGGGGAAGSMYEFLGITRKNTNDTSTVMTLKGCDSLQLLWLSEDTLKVIVPSNCRIDHFQDWFGSLCQGQVILEKQKPAIDSSIFVYHSDFGFTKIVLRNDSTGTMEGVEPYNNMVLNYYDFKICNYERILTNPPISFKIDSYFAFKIFDGNNTWKYTRHFIKYGDTLRELDKAGPSFKYYRVK